MSIHYSHLYLQSPPHKITVDLVGLGGTGSQVLTALARMNEALMGLNHPGLQIRAWDPDEVTAANMGRQLFSPADFGINKSMVLVQRVNRFFGYEWQAIPELYTGKLTSNITITCVDTAKARVQIGEKLMKSKRKNIEPFDEPLYWLDIGNLHKTGQVVIGTILPVAQPKKADHKGVANLKVVTKKFPQLKRIKEEQQGPSCSLAEALEKQDLFINSTLAQFGCNLLWKLIREGNVKHHGCYVNLETLTVNPIKIK